MNGLITGLSMFALGLGAVVLILIWHKYRIQGITGGNHEEISDCETGITDVDGDVLCHTKTRN